MTGPDRDQLLTVVERELRSVRRNPALLALVGVLVLVVVGVARLRGAGYIPLALDLVTVLEFLLPVVAFALGYRALLADRVRGELDMLRTYPIDRTTLVLGVFLGRAVPLLAGLVGSLVLAGVVVSMVGGPRSTVLATHAGGGGPVLYVRFIVLSAVFALVALAAALAISASTGSPRRALAFAGGLLVALVIGFDLAVIGGLAGGVVPDPVLKWLVAASPNSAYRGLILETVVAPVSTDGGAPANPIASAIGLGAWLLGALGIAVRSVWTT